VQVDHEGGHTFRQAAQRLTEVLVPGKVGEIEPNPWGLLSGRHDVV
jgi:hypothetical protein